MSMLTVTHVTPEEYLAAERLSETRSEYIDGGVIPVTGGSINHIRIVANLTAELIKQLRRRDCDVLPTEMKVCLQESRKFFYPDLCVVCDKPHFHDERRDIITNPALVIEVLSPSTEAFDRGVKLRAYQTIETLREYLLVSQDKPLIEQYIRDEGDEWRYRAAEGLASTTTLPSIECTLNLGAVYRRVDFTHEH